MVDVANDFAKAAQSYAAGNLSLAEQYCGSVLAAQPNHAEALRLLGVLAWQRGDLGQAIVFLNRSLASNGVKAATWDHLGDVHCRAGNFVAGATHYEQALRLQPDWAEVHNKLGLALQPLGKWDRAADSFRNAISIRPTFAAAYNNLGNVLRKLGKPADAVEAFEHALRLWPDNPDILYNLGTTHHADLEELDKAVAYYRQALGLGPAYAGDVSNSLATALKEQGLLDEAVSQYRETLRLRPDHAMAIFNLTELAAGGRYQFTPDDVGRIKALLASGQLSPLERSLCCFAQANILDKLGAYDEAFAFYRQANDLKKRLLQQQNSAFDAQHHQALLSRLMEAYDAPYFERVKTWGSASELPVFIIGMPRSGSTLVEQILASHPRVFGAGESDNMYRLLTLLTQEKSTGRHGSQLLPSAEIAQRMAADYLQHLARVGQGAARVTNKYLENFLHLGIIATLFPRARVIHCRRDPLDTCLSCYFQNFQDMIFAWSLEDIGAFYRDYEALMAHWSRVLPVKVHEVRYEELVNNQEAVSRALVAYCGLDWDERCLTFWNTRRVVRTASTVQVRKPLSSQAIGRWRHYRAHLGPLFRALGRSDANPEGT